MTYSKNMSDAHKEMMANECTEKSVTSMIDNGPYRLKIRICRNNKAKRLRI